MSRCFRVLVSDKLSEDGLAVLRKAPGFEVDYRPGLSEQELADAIPPYHALVIRSGSKVTANVLENAGNLKIVGRAGVGVDNVDLAAASRRGIAVVNTPGGNSVTTAEHAIALLMSLARHIPQATASMRQGKWEKSRFQGTQLAGKTLGIVGLGNIGRIVADRARGLKMTVLGSDPVMSGDRAAELGVRLVDLDTLFAESDFVTLHAPLTESTRHLLDDAAFAKMKDGVRIVHAARGGIVDEGALLRAIESGKVAGAALDVFEKEPIDPEHPLLREERVILTPHLGASTKEAQRIVAVQVAEQIVDFLLGKGLRNSVNVPDVPAELRERFTPYAQAARRLGRLLAALQARGVRRFEVTCTGEPAELGLRPLAYEALAAFLSVGAEHTLPAMAAPFEARERGIHITERSEDATEGHVHSIRIRLEAERGIVGAAAALGNRQEPRLVGFEGFDVDHPLAGTLLVMRNEDRPGIIGRVGTLLGERGINVSRAQVSLRPGEREALALWTVDAERVPSDLLDAIGAIEAVASVRAVRVER